MINFQFVSDALPEDTFQVLQFDAEEEVSQLFHVELRLVSRDPNIDFDLMLERSACLSIITKGKQRNIHGMLAEFEQGGEWQNGLYEYRALLVPRLWMLSQSTQNQIFQDQTVLDIVSSELKNVNKKGSNPLAEAGLGSDDDYEMFTIHQYEEREYVVQYKETDLNFISRLMEHEGLYYYFEHNDDCEKLVITDTFAEEHISDNSEALFQSEASGVRYDNRVVYKLSRMQKQIPSSVLVKDFNYRSPSLPMQAMGDIDESGIGFVTEFGAHFKSPEEGEALATVRAEEFKCRQNTYSGESNISDFSCGHVYSLSQHFRSDYNQSYMLTKVKHQGSQEIESWGNIGNTKYSNQFDCIPALLQFRPQRLAIKPRLFGIMNGVIDSEQDLGRADLDELGRYKVQMPFDISGVAPGLASRRIRMAQPYGGGGDDGGGTGMSFPLLKGTEVIWTCIDGDIDRPIITGAVPNPLKPSVTNTQNANSNVIKTSSGITMGFHDGPGGGANASTSSSEGLAAQQQNQRVNNSSKPSNEVQTTKPCLSNDFNSTNQSDYRVSTSAQANSLGTDVKNHELQLQQQNASNGHFETSTHTAAVAHVDANATTGAAEVTAVADNIKFVLDVPYQVADLTASPPLTDKKSYLRLGDKDTGADQKDGIRMYTDGNYHLDVKGDLTGTQGGKKSTVTKGTKFTYNISRTYSYDMSNNFYSKVGVYGWSTTGLTFKTNVGVTASLNFSLDVTFGIGSTMSFVKDTAISVSKEQNVNVDERFWAKVDPADGNKSGKLEWLMETKVPEIAAVLAVASSAASATIGSMANSKSATETKSSSPDDYTGLEVAAEAHAGSVYGAGAVLSSLALAYAWSKSDSTPPVVELDLWKGGNIPTKTNKIGTHHDPYAKLQVQHAKEKVHVNLRATAAHDNEDNASFINLVNTPEKAWVQIKAANTKESALIDLVGGAKDKDGGILLCVGRSSILISDAGIVFNSPVIEFKTIDEENVSIDKDGLFVNGGDLNVMKGNAFIKQDVYASNVVGKEVTSLNGGKISGGPSPKAPTDYKANATVKEIIKKMENLK